VEQVIMNPESSSVTPLLIGRGFLIEEYRLVPAFCASRMDDDQIRLSVDASLFERLQDYSPDLR